MRYSEGFIGIDFETRSGADIKKVGLDRYVSDPCFAPLVVSVVVGAEPLNYRLRPEITTYDFVTNGGAKRAFNVFLRDNRGLLAAHNAGFERAVLAKMGYDLRMLKFVDTAVIARIMGADSSLANCARQLLDEKKVEEGAALITKFCKPRKDGTFLVDHSDEWTTEDWADWNLFKVYCEQDAMLSWRFATKYTNEFGNLAEQGYEQLTSKMNMIGWPVDTLSVRLMEKRAEINKEEALAEFRRVFDPPRPKLDANGTPVLNHKGVPVMADPLNLNSLKQLKEWCKERGIAASSFDEKHVDTLATRIDKKLNDPTVKLNKGVRENYEAVLAMLRTKQTVGGASLKKLPVILERTGVDERLRHQYMHCGAGQTYRTSGTGVQMQNLKRLKTLKDMDTLADFNVPWTNDELAENIRQCFTASTPAGQLIVGDFSSVESRGLAYLAGAEWKLDAFRQGKDLYKVQAQLIYNLGYDDVTKTHRQTGKVGELSCGYGAGAGAVQAFAVNMGVEMSEQEAADLVSKWRAANPEIVDLWQRLDDLLHQAVSAPGTGRFEDLEVKLANNMSVRIRPTETPTTLMKQHPGSRSLELVLCHEEKKVLTRIFHGCYERGRNVCYYKPESNKSGKLWKATFTDTKTKKVRFYDIYGGKLAGILTQSFCRELFFMALDHLDAALPEGIDIIGQFHDEIVVDWNPSRTNWTLGETIGVVEECMSDAGRFTGFPLSAEVKHDYRYTK